MIQNIVRFKVSNKTPDGPDLFVLDKNGSAIKVLDLLCPCLIIVGYDNGLKLEYSILDSEINIAKISSSLGQNRFSFVLVDEDNDAISKELSKRLRFHSNMTIPTYVELELDQNIRGYKLFASANYGPSTVFKEYPEYVTSTGLELVCGFVSTE